MLCLRAAGVYISNGIGIGIGLLSDTPTVCYIGFLTISIDKMEECLTPCPRIQAIH